MYLLQGIPSVDHVRNQRSREDTISEHDANKQLGNFGNAESQETKRSGDGEDSNGSENIGKPTDIQQSYGAEGSNNQEDSSNATGDVETSEDATDIQQSYGGGDKTGDRANSETRDS